MFSHTRLTSVWPRLYNRPTLVTALPSLARVLWSTLVSPLLRAVPPPNYVIMVRMVVLNVMLYVLVTVATKLITPFPKRDGTM